MTLHSKTRNEVAAELGICTKTLRRWLKKHEIKITDRNLISPKELLEIYAAFGGPIVTYDV